MSEVQRVEIFRAALFDTPRNPFTYSDALRAYADGAIAVQNGTIAGSGSYNDVRRAHPAATVTDLRGGFVLPGFIDTHVHFPQIRILASFGCTLLDWLSRFALPEEAKFADRQYARTVAHEFVNALVSHGTTTALAFGSHFTGAMAELFNTAQSRGLRMISGLVLSDRSLNPSLHTTPERAYQESKDLIRRFHGSGLLTYAVTPRFALSASQPMLDVCGALMKEHATLRFTTHINENREEIAEVARLFPWSKDYLDVYEHSNLIGPRAVLAHNVHVTDSELERLAAHQAAIAHCPCSNAALGSGTFPLLRHVEHGVRCALGTDVGGGIGFGMMKEAVQAYLVLGAAGCPIALRGSHLLYLATRAGAEALQLDSEAGDLEVGKSADFVYLRPPAGSVLSAALEHRDDPERILTALFALADSETIRQVRAAGKTVFQRLDSQ